MAAPLPRGYELGVVPQAPSVDPRLFAPDVTSMLANVHTGLAVGQELANLENQRANRELVSAQIKAAKAKNDLEMLQIEASKTFFGNPENVKKIADLKAVELNNQITAARALTPIAGLNPLQAKYADTLVGMGVTPDQALSNLNVSTPAATPPAAPAAPAAGNGFSFSQVLGATGAPPAPAAPAALSGVSLGGIPSTGDRTTDMILGSPANRAKIALQAVERQNAARIEAEKAKLTAQTQIATDRAKTIQDEFKKANVPVAQYYDADGKFDADRAEADLNKLREQQPRTFATPQQAQVLDRAYNVASFSDYLSEDLPGLMNGLKTPTFWENAAAAMQDKQGKGFIQSSISSLMGKGITADVARRQAVIDYLNRRVQDTLNTTAEGRTVRSLAPIPDNATNEQIVAYASELKLQLSREYSTLKSGQAPWLFSDVDRKVESIAAAAERRRQNAVTPAKNVASGNAGGQVMRGPDGKFYLLYRDEAGNVRRRPYGGSTTR